MFYLLAILFMGMMYNISVELRKRYSAIDGIQQLPLCQCSRLRTARFQIELYYLKYMHVVGDIRPLRQYRPAENRDSS